MKASFVLRLPALLLFLSAILAAEAASQDKRIDEITYSTAIAQSRRPASEWKGKGRRWISTNEDNFKHMPKYFRKSITEISPTGDRRTVTETQRGDQKFTQEIINIGQVVFNRNGTGKWEKKISDSTNYSTSLFMFESDGPVEPITYSIRNDPGSSIDFTLTAGVYKGETLSIYVRTTRSAPQDKGGPDISKEVVIRTWIGKAGRAVKFEQIESRAVKFEQIENYRGSTMQGSQKHIDEWEPDPNIVVIEPVVPQ